ncbi:AAA family ATPase [Nostoc sp. ChiQUE01b]|uniref:AAA family ATPase n=1 Tax=Nostoc sp. ChiQUE01b TaxID=3075376 RepID=UPI002AD5402B|nr:AAA family ATPase [Nostoc sp. ChiQUE01b]MDZ8260168.1 AAA family ATPase [Nostoc sp. ChiQUE01b]
MRIKQISVSGLFGIFDHVIPLNMDERITIIHGPNGFGKTAILRILNSFFNSRNAELKAIEFRNFRVDFDNNSSIEIIKDADKAEESQKTSIGFKFYQPDSEPAYFYLKPINILNIRSDIDFQLGILDKVIPGLERIASHKWLYEPTGETLSLEEVVERFDNLLPLNLRQQEEPEWLEELKNNIHIRLIESQRLLNFVPKRFGRTYRGTSSILSMSTVSAYSDELAQIMQDKFKEYGTISQSLDRTFPVRVVKQQLSADLTNEQLRNELNELEATRSRLLEVGLLDKDEDSEFQIQPQDIDEKTKNALSVYVEDVEKKLSVFAEIASKIDLLRKIINNKFAYSYKEINFSKDKGFVFTTLYNSSLSDSKALSPTDLSSGEQHELVLLYELLFKVQPNSLVLIDEPELSLHVGWQVQFLKDLQDITQLADLNILMATHSPDIIQDRWDLTVELKGPQK